MTLTEYLFCYSVAPHPPHPNHLSIVSGHALWVLKILPFCVDSLPVSFVYHFHWTLMVEICFLDLDLALVYPPFCIALSCCEKWPSQVLQRMTAVEKSSALCSAICSALLATNTAMGALLAFRVQVCWFCCGSAGPKDSLVRTVGILPLKPLEHRHITYSKLL